jgi:hypothetical protein
MSQKEICSHCIQVNQRLKSTRGSAGEEQDRSSNSHSSKVVFYAGHDHFVSFIRFDKEKEKGSRKKAQNLSPNENVLFDMEARNESI